MLDATVGRRKRQIATSWNELTAAQLLAVTKVQGQPLSSEALLRILLRVPRRVFARLNTVQRHELARYTDFLREPAAHAPLTAQLLPVLWCRLRRYHAPRERFRNLLFSEFIFADAYFLRYLQTKEEAALDSLVAVLYRPQRTPYHPLSAAYAGDRREDFNEHLVPARARRLAHLPHHVKYAVLLWYRGCRQQLETRYDYVFTTDTTARATKSGWNDVLHHLAGSLAHLDATADQFLHTVLREMNRLLKQAEDRATTTH